MKRSRPSRPRVKLNRDAVWELLDRLGMPWNEPARRWYGNAADLHHPRPGDSQIRDITQKNTAKEQEHTATEMLACSGDPPLCRGVDVKGGEISYHVGGAKLYHSSRLDPRCCS